MLDLIKFLFSGDAKFAFLIYFGIVSFTIAFISALGIMLFHGYWTDRYIQKLHFKIWKIPDGKSFKKAAEYGRALKSLNDPVLKKISARRDKYAKSCLLVWLILFLLVAIIVLFLHMLGI